MKSEPDGPEDLLNKINVVVWKIDGLPTLNGARVSFVNESIYALTGYTSLELLEGDIDIKDLFRKPEWKKFVRGHNEMMRTGETRYSYFNITTKSGKALWVKTHPTVLYNAQHIPIGICSMVTDVTREVEDQREKKFTEDRIQKKQENEIEQRKSEFISVASHELKTPVTSMRIYAELLKNKLFTETESYHYVNKLLSQIDRLTELIREMLDISRLETRKFILVRDVININNLVSLVSKDLEETFKKHRIVITEETGPVKVYGDHLRLTQVMVNLISNAVKYSPKSTLVEILIKSDDKMGYVGVRDTGIGISKENQKNLFKPFFRASGTNERTYPGLGVGLYISSEIVQRHGGEMWVESKKGKGSTFWFSLPKEGISK